MIQQQDIQRRTVEGRRLTYIAIGDAAGELPRYMLQGRKEPGYIVKGNSLEPWYWESFSEQGGVRYVYFPAMEISPIDSLRTSLRDRALPLVQELAEAIQKLPKDFLKLNNGVLPIWRIYFIQGGGILFFPEFLSDIIAATGDDNDRYDSINGWIRHGLEASFTLCDQMTQFLYFAATGKVPYHSPVVRETKFRVLPLVTSAPVLAPTLDSATRRWIDAALTLSNNDQKKATGNKSPAEGLQWWLSQTAALQWKLPALPGVLDADIMARLQADSACSAYLVAQAKKAAHRIFWRKKGWIVALCVVIVAGVSAFAGSQIKRALTPPYTAGMTPEQVITEYYTGQNELDIQKLEASLSGKAKSPVSMEVSNLFVTRQMRIAYEGINALIPAPDWNDQGRPAIPDYAFIYGVDDIIVQQTGQNTWVATSVLYSPYDYEDLRPADDEDTLELPASESKTMTVHLYEQTQEFTLELNKKGWWEITHIGDLYYTPAGTLTVELYTQERAGGLGMSQGGSIL